MIFKRKDKKKTQARVCAIIPAAGSSARMGGQNKLMMELGEMPVLVRTIEAFQLCPLVEDIVITCRERDIMPYSRLMKAYGLDKVRHIVCGGETRSASVLAGICACSPETDFVAVHDGARPLVSQKIIEDTIQAAWEHGAAAPVTPMKDSIKRIENGRILTDVARDKIAAVQTPQVFRRTVLMQALENAIARGSCYTDDCAAVEVLGVEVYATEGDYQNIKITTPEDITIGEAILYHQEGTL